MVCATASSSCTPIDDEEIEWIHQLMGSDLAPMRVPACDPDDFITRFTPGVESDCRSAL
jgi:hypothetical protein